MEQNSYQQYPEDPTVLKTLPDSKFTMRSKSTVAVIYHRDLARTFFSLIFTGISVHSVVGMGGSKNTTA